MNNRMVEVWAVYSNTDLTEGRGRDYIAKLCRTREVARRHAHGKYVQGSDAPIAPVDAIEISPGSYVLTTDVWAVEEATQEDAIESVKTDALKRMIALAEEAGISDDEIVEHLRRSRGPANAK